MIADARRALQRLRDLWVYRTRRHDPRKDINVAGIYNVCASLGLPKWGPPKNTHLRALATMNSGKVALYQYHDWEPAWNVDWCWHTFRCLRYAKPDEIASLPWLNNPTPPLSPLGEVKER